jgi:hypothetical protein
MILSEIVGMPNGLNLPLVLMAHEFGFQGMKENFREQSAK